MSSGAYQISLSFGQIRDLVKQLSSKEKLMLSKELEADTKNKTLSALLASFKTDELTQEEIDAEVESVRAELSAKF